MEIYLDANATTPVLPQARVAAVAAMASTYGNPSSVHSAGIRARALLDSVRATARRILGAPTGEIVFTSGATEGIQTAVVSALCEIRRMKAAGHMGQVHQLLYGATEHKAVSEALTYWNEALSLNLAVRAIPVKEDGLHDLVWLREQAPYAGLVCTMAANNETGVISDLDGIQEALTGTPPLWMVDSVQALGKIHLRLSERPIDYAPFSGHKLYAPKGVGMLYVRDGAPFSPLMIGGGQEGAFRSGTENMAGIAAMGAILSLLEVGEKFKDQKTLQTYSEQLRQALRKAFPGVVFNAPPEKTLPTTINFSVPGLSSRLLLDLFDAAEVRVSGGSACSAAKALPSYVLKAMGLPDWQAASAVRLSFGAADDAAMIQEACLRIQACGEAVKQHCLGSSRQSQPQTPAVVTRFAADGVCSYVVADRKSQRCLAIDPTPATNERLAHWVKCHGYTLIRVLLTHERGGADSPEETLRSAAKGLVPDEAAFDVLGWSVGAPHLDLGEFRVRKVPVPEPANHAALYVLERISSKPLVFVGDLLVRSELSGSTHLENVGAVQALRELVDADALLLPHRDPYSRVATTLRAEASVEPQTVEADWKQLNNLLNANPQALVVDVREGFEQTLSEKAGRRMAHPVQRVPLSEIVNLLPEWMALDKDTPIVFMCRSGNRSAQAASALRRLGHANAWSLAGGLALREDEAQPAESLELWP